MAQKQYIVDTGPNGELLTELSNQERKLLLKYRMRSCHKLKEVSLGLVHQLYRCRK